MALQREEENSSESGKTSISSCLRRRKRKGGRRTEMLLGPLTCVLPVPSTSEPVMFLTSSQVNVAANILLLIAKIIAAFYSSSLSLIASLVDSALDLLCTLIVWTTSRLVKWRLNSLKRRFPVSSSLQVTPISPSVSMINASRPGRPSSS
jgi:hypothetical protein